MGGIIGKFIGQELADTASARTAMRNGPKNSVSIIQMNKQLHLHNFICSL